MRFSSKLTYTFKIDASSTNAFRTLSSIYLWYLVYLHFLRVGFALGLNDLRHRAHFLKLEKRQDSRRFFPPQLFFPEDYLQHRGSRKQISLHLHRGAHEFVERETNAELEIEELKVTVVQQLVQAGVLHVGTVEEVQPVELSHPTERYVCDFSNPGEMELA